MFAHDARLPGFVYFVLLVSLCSHLNVHANVTSENHKSSHCSSKDSPTLLNTTRGAIELDLPNTQNYSSCYWKFDFKPDAKDPFFLEFRSINLIPGDELKLITLSNKTFKLDKRTPGFYISAINQELNGSIIVIEFSKSDNTSVRILDLFYQSDSKKAIVSNTNIGNYWIATDKYDDKTTFQNVLVTFSNKNWPNQKLAVNVQNLKLPKKTSALVNNDVLTDTNDILIDQSTFILNFKSISFESDVQINLDLDFVDSDCSSIQNLDDRANVVLKTISSKMQFVKNSYNCLNILSVKDKLFLFSEFQANTVFDLDYLEIRDGARKNSPQLFYSNPPKSFKVLNQKLNLLNLVSKGSSIYVSYKSPSTFLGDNVTYVPNELIFNVTSNIKRFNGSNKQSQSITPTVDVFNAILYEANALDRAVIQFKGKSNVLVDVDVQVFDTFDQTSKPILNIRKNNGLPSEIISNTNKLLLIFNVAGNKPNNFDFDLFGKNDTCSFTVGHPCTFGIVDNANLISKTCDFLFGDASDNLVKKYDFSLKLDHLLLNTKDDCLSLEAISADSNSQIFKICGPSPSNQSIDIIPNMLFNSSQVYKLRFERSKEEATNASILSASLNLVPISVLSQHSLASDTERNVTLPNYPNSYPLMASPGVSHLIVTNQLLYTSFNDLDLAQGDVLTVYPANASTSAYNFSGHNLPEQDFIVKERLLLLMKPGSIQERLNRKEYFASGYSANVQTLECGGMITGTEVESTNYPETIKNVTKGCTWILDASSGDKTNWLQFTVEYGKDGNDGSLRVYDNPTKRRNLFANLTSSGPYNVSVPKIIIEYSVKKTGPLKAIKLKFERQPCNATCDNNQRCVTDWSLCDGTVQCLDFKDELHCNTTFPTPEPRIIKSGLSGWVIVLVIIPISMAIGALSALFGPQYINRLRGRHYQEFPNFEDA